MSAEASGSATPESDSGTPAPEAPTATRTYESAVARVEEIIRRLDSGDAGLRETLDLVAEGRGLVEYCAGELEAVSQGLQELRLDELVTRLETR
jgi:exodeoxyribonuclease VII small subunit